MVKLLHEQIEHHCERNYFNSIRGRSPPWTPPMDPPLNVTEGNSSCSPQLFFTAFTKKSQLCFSLILRIDFWVSERMIGAHINRLVSNGVEVILVAAFKRPLVSIYILPSKSAHLSIKSNKTLRLVMVRVFVCHLTFLFLLRQSFLRLKCCRQRRTTLFFSEVGLKLIEMFN